MVPSGKEESGEKDAFEEFAPVGKDAKAIVIPSSDECDAEDEDGEEDIASSSSEEYMGDKGQAGDLNMIREEDDAEKDDGDEAAVQEAAVQDPPPQSPSSPSRGKEAAGKAAPQQSPPSPSGFEGFVPNIGPEQLFDGRSACLPQLDALQTLIEKERQMNPNAKEKVPTDALEVFRDVNVALKEAKQKFRRPAKNGKHKQK